MLESSPDGWFNICIEEQKPQRASSLRNRLICYGVISLQCTVTPVFIVPPPAKSHFNLHLHRTYTDILIIGLLCLYFNTSINTKKQTHIFIIYLINLLLFWLYIYVFPRCYLIPHLWICLTLLRPLCLTVCSPLWAAVSSSTTPCRIFILYWGSEWADLSLRWILNSMSFVLFVSLAWEWQRSLTDADDKWQTATWKHWALKWLVSSC